MKNKTKRHRPHKRRRRARANWRHKRYIHFVANLEPLVAAAFGQKDTSEKKVELQRVEAEMFGNSEQ